MARWGCGTRMVKCPSLQFESSVKYLAWSSPLIVTRSLHCSFLFCNDDTVQHTRGEVEVAGDAWYMGTRRHKNYDFKFSERRKLHSPAARLHLNVKKGFRKEQ